MHPYLISQLATDTVHERIGSSERERLGHQAVLAAAARRPRSPRALSGLQRVLGTWLLARPAWSGAFPTIDRPRSETCPEGECA